MADDIKMQRGQLDEIHRERAQLIVQIRASQRTIERSQELIKRIDEMLAKAVEIPPGCVDESRAKVGRPIFSGCRPSRLLRGLSEKASRLRTRLLMLATRFPWLRARRALLNA